MHKCKHERYILSLLIERTLFIYNIVLSNSSNITKKYKKKCIRLLIELQKYFRNTKYQHFDEKSIKYQFNQYKILMNRLDYLLKLFDVIDGSENIKNIWSVNLNNYCTEMMNPMLYNLKYDKNYIRNFIEYFIKITNIKSLIDEEMKTIYTTNKFYLL